MLNEIIKHRKIRIAFFAHTGDQKMTSCRLKREIEKMRKDWLIDTKL